LFRVEKRGHPKEIADRSVRVFGLFVHHTREGSSCAAKIGQINEVKVEALIVVQYFGIDEQGSLLIDEEATTSTLRINVSNRRIGQWPLRQARISGNTGLCYGNLCR
jgi:hypothetical protein